MLHFTGGCAVHGNALLSYLTVYNLVFLFMYELIDTLSKLQTFVICDRGDII